MNPKPKVVLIGWHGADWKLIHPLVDAGLMPNLRALIERGVIGGLRPKSPAAPAIAWTTLITGRPADEHGILSSIEVDPFTGALQAVSGMARRAPALWDIAMQAGIASCLVDWPVTHPAEPLTGVCVSGEFFRLRTRYGKPWPVTDQSVYPEALVNEIAALRFHPGELTGNDLLPFLPGLAGIDQEEDGRVVEFAAILARAIGVHAVSTHLMEHRPAGLTLIGWRATEDVCRKFLRYAPPRLPFVSEDDYAKYREVVNGMYCFHDMLLGRVVQLAGPDAAIAIVSPGGFRVGAERPQVQPARDSEGPWRRPSGMFCFAGPNIRGEELLHGATLFDVAPTVLAMLALPARQNMPGRVLREVFIDPVGVKRVAGRVARSDDASREPEVNAGSEALRKLKSLGYHEPLHYAPNVRLVEREQLRHTAFIHMGRKRYKEARADFENLAADGSPALRNQFHLWSAHCSLLDGDRAACLEMLGRIDHDGTSGAIASLIEAQLAEKSGPALAAIDSALTLDPDVGFVNYMAGVLYARLKRWKKAEAALRRAIEIDPVFQPAHDLLARVLTVRGKRNEAVDAALAGLEIDNSSAASQFTLGLALHFAGERPRAAAAFGRARHFRRTS